ncbi:hypothetical protein PUR23_28675 [Methylorubrum populi]|uniref:hypothetical protein n=1 Tax=Methylorubrum populi TaxID=223967 RepID=UPI0031FA0797
MVPSRPVAPPRPPADRSLRPRPDRQQPQAGLLGTSGEFGCGNFEAVPPPPMPKGGGFVTIWQGGRIVWEGHEEAIPARFLQEDLDL